MADSGSSGGTDPTALDPDSAVAFVNALRQVLELVAAVPQRGQLVEQIEHHLGTDPRQLPVVGEDFEPLDHPNVQLALDRLTTGAGRTARLVGFGADNKRMMAFGLTDLLGRGGLFAGPLRQGPVDYVNVHLHGGQVLACVSAGFYLLEIDGSPLVVFVNRPPEMAGPRRALRVDVMAAAREDAQHFLAELVRTVDEVNVFRGKVVSLEVPQSVMGPPAQIAVFHRFAPVERDDVVLAPGVLERIERETVDFGEYAGELRAAGQSLKRGLLLHGLPGTGKTYVVRYLCGRMPGRTVVVISGLALGMVTSAVRMARTLAPAMVVVEDCDLIAQERSLPGREGPLLFELLNEMEGMADDRDVILLLTTNRPDLLEPALAARPGRIDLAVELSLPDLAGRLRLIELYGRGLSMEGIEAEELARRIEGATPAYVKELLRKSALAAVTGTSEVVRPEHVEAALGELAAGGRLAERLVGFRPDHGTGPPRPSGFPGAGAGVEGAAGVVSRPVQPGTVTGGV